MPEHAGPRFQSMRLLNVLDVPESVVDLDVIEQAIIEVSNKQGSVRVQLPPVSLIRSQSKGNGEVMMEVVSIVLYSRSNQPISYTRSSNLVAVMQAYAC